MLSILEQLKCNGCGMICPCHQLKPIYINDTIGVINMCNECKKKRRKNNDKK